MKRLFIIACMVNWATAAPAGDPEPNISQAQTNHPWDYLRLVQIDYEYPFALGARSGTSNVIYFIGYSLRDSMSKTCSVEVMQRVLNTTVRSFFDTNEIISITVDTGCSVTVVQQLTNLVRRCGYPKQHLLYETTDGCFVEPPSSTSEPLPLHEFLYKWDHEERVKRHIREGWPTNGDLLKWEAEYMNAKAKEGANLQLRRTP